MYVNISLSRLMSACLDRFYLKVLPYSSYCSTYLPLPFASCQYRSIFIQLSLIHEFSLSF